MLLIKISNLFVLLFQKRKESELVKVGARWICLTLSLCPSCHLCSPSISVFCVFVTSLEIVMSVRVFGVFMFSCNPCTYVIICCLVCLFTYLMPRVVFHVLVCFFVSFIHLGPQAHLILCLCVCLFFYICESCVYVLHYRMFAWTLFVCFYKPCGLWVCVNHAWLFVPFA